MARSRLTPVFVVLVALTLFVSGMLAYKLAIGSPAHPAAIWGGSSAKSDSFSIEGRALIQVYRADGTLSATWRGHNDLTPFGKNAIAGCFSGLTTTPYAGLGSCGGWTRAIHVLLVAGPIQRPMGENATNTAVPAGCDPATGQAALCTGWQTQASFYINQAGTLTNASAASEKAPFSSQTKFDIVSITPSPGLAVNVGDTAVITITFSVS